MSQSLLVVTKDEEKGAKGISAMKIQSHSLSPKTTKDEFVTLLKVIDDRPLFIMFLRSQRKFLETKGIINQFTKMDVKKLLNEDRVLKVLYLFAGEETKDDYEKV